MPGAPYKQRASQQRGLFVCPVCSGREDVPVRQTLLRAEFGRRNAVKAPRRGLNAGGNRVEIYRARRAIRTKGPRNSGAFLFVRCSLVVRTCSFDKLCSKQSLDAKAQRRRPGGGSTREATALRSIVPGAPSTENPASCRVFLWMRVWPRQTARSTNSAPSRVWTPKRSDGAPRGLNAGGNRVEVYRASRFISRKASTSQQRPEKPSS